MPKPHPIFPSPMRNAPVMDAPQTLTEKWLINDYLNGRIDAHELDRRLNEILGIQPAGR
jgi:hypothetical protein